MIKRYNKNNVVFYFDENKNKQVNEKKGRAKWTRENATKIENGVIPYDTLSKSEKLSYQFQKRLKFKGKVIKKTTENVLRKQLMKIGFDIPYGKSLEDILPPEAFEGTTPEEMIKNFSQGVFIQDKEYKVLANFSVMKTLTKKYNDGEKIKVVVDGQSYEGLEAIEQLRRWESQEREIAVEEGASKSFFTHKLFTSWDEDDEQFENEINVEDSERSDSK